ncbi:MAG: aliphatic sulfonate ABC transporter substrate-binding protein [Nostoc sp. LLA-1]|nr:aliphatic sulfonate ABC transporter substrate-binding protein [Cyanocohniella sp. LLY]
MISISHSKNFFLTTLLMSSMATACNRTTGSTTAVSVSNPTSENPQLLRLGFQRGGVIPISRQRGELERQLSTQNIKVEWSGPFDRCATLLQALNGNRADIGGCGDIPSISGIAAGQPLCIGSLQRPKPDALGNAIVVRGDSNIQKPSDLIGKKVAVNQGGAGEYLLLKVLEKENIPVEQVQRVYLAPTDAAPALYQGTIDAWAVWEPYVSIAELEHNARRITTTHPSPTYGVMLVRTGAAEENPAAVKTTLTALSQDGEWLNKNQDAAADYMVKELKIPEAVAKQATKNRGEEYYVFPTDEDVANLQVTADWLLEQKILPQRVDIASAICPLDGA